MTQQVLEAYERFCPRILSDLMHEVVRAEKLHGTLPISHERASNIAGEEMGEVCEATLDHVRYLEGKTAPPGDTKLHLREEWIQLAAAAIRAVENLDKEE